MAAITPFLGRQVFDVTDDGTDVVQPEPRDMEGVVDDVLAMPAELLEEARAIDGLQGLDRVSVPEDLLAVNAAEMASLNQSHAALLQVAWMRDLAYKHLRGRVISVRQVGRQIVLQLSTHDRPDVPLPLWNPPPNMKHATPKGAVKLLTWTSKMGAWSFSIPAGAPAMGGSCVGASGGQSLVPASTFKTVRDRVQAFSPRRKLPVLGKAVCQHCYAEGGQYATWQVQVVQGMRFAWMLSALRDGSFVPVMVKAIESADYLLEGGRRAGHSYAPEAHEGRFFRWHDSGDIYSEAHLHALVEIARQCPTVNFWAPTRIWATPWGPTTVDEIARSSRGWPQNFALRPSAYYVDEPVPTRDQLGAGWAAGTTVFSEAVDPSVAAQVDWECPTYRIEDTTASCRNSENPEGGLGCRACWVHQNAVVVYALH